MRPAALARGLLFAQLAWALCGCSGDPPPSVDLARLYRPDATAVVEASGRQLRLSSGAQLTLELEDGRAWLVTELPREAWRFVPAARTWNVNIEDKAFGSPQDGSAPHRLRDPASGREYSWISPRKVLPNMERVENAFLVGKSQVRLTLPEGEEPPARLSLGFFCGRGRPERVGEGESWRIEGDRFSGAGFPLWSGEEVKFELELEEPARLRFATANEPFEGIVLEPGAQVEFRLFVDDQERLHQRQPAGESRSVWHAIELSAGAHRLRFGASGAFAFTSILTPRIVPDSVSSEEPGRPDLLLFQADTFRADNMAAYGGRLSLTPRLDRLALDGVLFERAWSTGTYTLPAHASLFTGVFPREAGIRGGESALGSGLETVAERLRRFGYRTGAITDSVIVSRRYGLDRGFAYFDEYRNGLDSTFARAEAFLDQADGRPLFLFVQTYRVHAPYVVSQATREAHAERLGIQGEFETWSDRRLELIKGGLDRPGAREELAQVVRQLEAFYRGGVLDFDLGFDRFHTELGRRDFFDRGFLVFVSDHGEAFWEHGEIFHTGSVWEEQVRVPLFVIGPHLAPRRVSHAASLVDVAPTLLAVSGIGPFEHTGGGARGTNLLALKEDRPVFAFECFGPPTESTCAVVDGPRKLIAYESEAAIAEGYLVGAFDLEADPGEQADLREESWVAPMLERFGPRLGELLRSRVNSEDAELDPRKLEELGDLGYVFGEEEH